MVEVNPRLPCERCGCRLYYHEQRERWCRQCSAKLEISRLCDADNRRTRSMIRL